MVVVTVVEVGGGGRGEETLIRPCAFDEDEQGAINTKVQHSQQLANTIFDTKKGTPPRERDDDCSSIALLCIVSKRREGPSEAKGLRSMWG